MKEHILTATFLALSLVGCAKHDHEEPPTAPTTSPSSPSPRGSKLVYDGYGACYRVVGGKRMYADCPDSLLPPPPTDRLVYKYNGCQSVPKGQRVRCPEGGPTAILPGRTSIEKNGHRITLQMESLHCIESQGGQCPPHIPCDPAAPRTVPCPPELLPRLRGDLEPTRRQGDRCWFGAVEVACPEGRAVPATPSSQATGKAPVHP